MYILLKFNNQFLTKDNLPIYNLIDEFENNISTQKIKENAEKKFHVRLIDVQQENSINLAVCIIDKDSYIPKNQLITIDKVEEILVDTPFSNIGHFIALQKKSTVKLKYGIREDKVVFIDEINSEEKGLKCACYCPCCNEKLQAKIGTGKKQKHFAHNNSNCNIEIAQQTALHMLAKEIIAENKKIMLPAISIDECDITKNELKCYFENADKNIINSKPKLLVVNNVKLEKKISNIVPDVIVEYKDQQVLIEVAVTHFIDNEKLEKIRKIGLPVLEIDLSDYMLSVFTRNDLIDLIENKVDNKKWIYSNKKAQNIAKIESVLQKCYDDKQLEIKKEIEKKEKEERRKIKAQQTVNYLLNNDNEYQKVLQKLRISDEKVKEFINKKFHTKFSDIPFYFDIPISCEMVFNCDRRIWQSAIFRKFIYNRSAESTQNIKLRIKKITSWLMKHQNEVQVNFELLSGVSNTPYSYNKNSKILLLFKVVEQYIWYLEYLGFLNHNGYESYTVRARNTFDIPNRKNCEFLLEALNKVDLSSPFVNSDIYKLLSINLQEEQIQYVSTYEVYNNTSITNKTSSLKNKDTSLKISQEKAEIEKLKLKQRLQNQVKKCDFYSNEIIRDLRGNRWVLCTQCKKLYFDNEMVYYQSNQGICSYCNRSNELEKIKKDSEK